MTDSVVTDREEGVGEGINPIVALKKLTNIMEILISGDCVTYRLFSKNCAFSSKCCDFFLTLPVLWRSTCHLAARHEVQCTHTDNKENQSLEYILISSKKHNY